MKTLSNKQKSVLCQVARRAFDHLVAKGQLTGISFTDWRHESAERAVGIASLKEVGNDQYNRLLAHWSDLADEPGQALNALLREQTDPRRRAEAALVLAMDRAGLGPAYVEKICRDKFKCSVTEASTSALHQLIVTVKSRHAARQRKAALVHPSPSVQSVSNPASTL